MMRWFEYEHLPHPLRGYSEMCAMLALWMDDHLAEGAEKTAGMRKLLEAKDCFVRAKLEADSPMESASGCSHKPGECSHNSFQISQGA